jgi:hypothetical protein
VGDELKVLFISKGGELKCIGIKLNQILDLGVESVVVFPNSLDKGVVMGE